MKNPLNITSHCPQGQRLPLDWKQQAKARATQADADYLARLTNAWKSAGANAQQHLPPMQAARLRQDAAPTPHHAHNQSTRMDGAMELLEERPDGEQVWRDKATGIIVRRRLQWSDIIGRR